MVTKKLKHLGTSVPLYINSHWTPKKLISDVIRAVKLIIAKPATNAVSERSFSAMRRLYTYTRTNMTSNRLNNMMVLHVHKEKVDFLSLIDVANSFVEHSQHRFDIFGEFSDVDRCAKIVSVKSICVQANLK